MSNKKSTFIFLLLIIAIAVFFRLWQLDKVPPGLYHDEAINGNEALFAPGKIFYPENNGREGLFINLISLSFLTFGASIWSLRFIPAIIGILTILGLYLLTEELFSQVTRDRKEATCIALLASFLLAVSFWHVNFSRIVFRAILVPFILVFSFYFLLKGFKNQKISNFIISGIFFGLGFYTYIAFRLAVLLLAVILLIFWFNYKKQKQERKYLSLVVYFLLFTFIVALPIGIHFLQSPEDFLGRASGVSIFAQKNPILAFFTSLVSHLGMFNFHGDNNWRHNLSGYPQLCFLVGILFLIGLFLSLKELKKSIKEKNNSLFTVHFSLISWFFIMLLPGILSYESIPHALRTIGVIPVVHILAGLGGWRLYQKLKIIIKNQKLLILISILVLITIATFQFSRYSILWGTNPQTKDAFSQNQVAIGNYLNSLPEKTQKIVIVNQVGVPVPWPDGIPMPSQTIMFTENIEYGGLRSLYLLPEKINEIQINEEPTVIVPLHYDRELFQELKIMFPQGKIESRNGNLMYKIEPYVQ
jgi:4-amino-4-deoxy-L-arabinose transferase-like glycosyltransferase